MLTSDCMFSYERGYLTVGSFGSAPIRIHVTTPIGAYVFAGFRFDAAYVIGFMLIVLVHELGHAIAVRVSGAYVESVDVLPIGGVCRWQGSVSNFDRACIAFAGVWAQAVLLLLAWSYVRMNGHVMNPFGLKLMNVFMTTNVYMMAINMLPVPPLDGAEAWKFFPLLTKRLWRARKQRDKVAQLATLERKLKTLQAEDERQSDDEPPRYLN